MMRVEILSIEGLEVAEKAAAVCVGAEADPGYRHMRHALESGHLSVAEHIVISYHIEGISRACSHQLVRHRMMSVSQQSQRYVAVDKFGYVVPKSIGNNPVMLKEYADIMMELSCLYNSMVTDYNIPAEDARAVLPNACTTEMVVTLNLRELIHMCNLRLCERSQEEIRRVVGIMRTMLIDELKHRTGAEQAVKVIEGLVVPQCKMLDYCPEAVGCGKYPPRGWR